MQIKKAQFVTSVADAGKIYKSDLNEVAFVGRSNVGKSSLINALCNNKKLAKTSSVPGKTRLINYFLINDSFMLVDLPGYGYAKASHEQQNKWPVLIEEYLKNNPKLKCVFILLDIRHLPTDKDKQMLQFLYFYQIPVMFVATKCDKLSRAQIEKQLKEIAAELKIAKDNIIATSADSKNGIGELLSAIEKKVN